MDWGLYWTIVAQVTIAEAILGLPTALTVFAIRSGWKNAK